MKIQLTIFLFLLFFVSQVPAQNTKDIEVQGNILSTDNMPIPHAQIQMTLLTDSTIKKLTTTDPQGHFTIRLGQGRYQIRVSCIGFHSLTSQVECFDNVEIKALTLAEQSHDIGEVTVKARRVTFNSKGYSVNILNEPLYERNTLAETLGLMPGLTLTGGKLQAYHGDVLSVFINNKKLRLPMENIIQVLGTYESKNIRTIEVLNNTADPEVSNQLGYVIKITTKHVDDGGQMTIGLADNIGNTQRNTVSPWLSIQQRTGKWSFYLSPSYTPRSRMYRNQNSHTSYYESQRERDEHSEWAMTFKPRVGGTASVAYDFSDSQSVILTASGQHFRREHDIQTSNILTEGGTNTLTEGHTIRSVNSNNFNASLDYNAKLGRLALTASAAYSSQTQDGLNSREQAVQANTQPAWSVDQDTKYRVGLFTVLGTWSIDDSQSATLMLRHVNWNNRTESRYTAVPDQDNTFLHKEQTYTAQASYALKKGIADLNAGLELTHDVQSPEVLYKGKEISFKRSYTYLLPSATLTLAANQDKNIYVTIQYARTYRIPSFSLYDQNTIFRSEYSYTKGNPDIEPDIADELRMLTHIGGWGIGTIACFEKASAAIYGVDEQGMEYTSYDNNCHTTVLNASVSTPRITPCKGWHLTAQAYYQWDKSNYLSHVMHASRVGVTFTSTNKLPWDMTMTMRGNFQTRYYTLYGYSTNPGGVSLSVTRTWLKGVLTSSLNVTYNCLQKNTLQTDDYTQHSRYTKPETRLSLSLRYRIGWGNKRAQAKKRTMTDSELQRME